MAAEGLPLPRVGGAAGGKSPPNKCQSAVLARFPTGRRRSYVDVTGARADVII
jgi:hypothetical protein